ARIAQARRLASTAASYFRPSFSATQVAEGARLRPRADKVFHFELVHLRPNGTRFPKSLSGQKLKGFRGTSDAARVVPSMGGRGGWRGKRGSWLGNDGPEQAAGDREQGRQGGASEGHSARVDQRGSARGRPQGRHGEPPPEAGAAGPVDGRDRD